MSLKDEYELFVVKPKQNHLKGLVSQVIKHCKDEMALGEELPYVLTLDNAEINSVHELTPLLKDEGIDCSACFNSTLGIEVTIHKFI